MAALSLPERFVGFVEGIARGNADVVEVPVGPLGEFAAVLVALPPDMDGLGQLGQNAVSMIEATVGMLLQQLADDAVTRDHIVVPIRLVTRKSARLPPS